MRSYELILIVHPEVDRDGLAAVIERVKGFFEAEGGRVTRVEPWGMRRLAYPIRNLWEGQYVLMHVELQPFALAEVERGLGLTEEILRHLIVRLEEPPGKRAEELRAEQLQPVEGAAEFYGVGEA